MPDADRERERERSSTSFGKSDDLEAHRSGALP
jgi:hypothetical protein